MKLGRLPRPVWLLGAQALALGLASGFTIIPTAGIFLDAYGADALAWVYLVVAAVGAALVPIVNGALARRSLASVSAVSLATITALLGAAWIGLEVTGDAWISFPLQVLFPTVLQIGFVLIGAQAGLLLTVRELKEHFARIASGFVLGFFASGVVSAPLLSALGATHRLLFLAALAGAAMFALIVRTGIAYGAELRTPPPRTDETRPGTTISARRLLGRPLVLSLLAYQFLSALGTQLVDYLVYDRAAARYTTSDELARFTSTFTVVLNVVALVFVSLVAGRLLRRFGMRAGLMMNPAVVMVLIVGALIAAASGGVAAIGVFVAVGAARVSDISLTDGATRGSINTAYQALPTAERLRAQAMVEGIGQPAALGVTGLLLLLLHHVLDAGTGTVLAVTAVIGAAWTISGLDSYRRYRAALHEALRSRTLRSRSTDPAALDAVDEFGSGLVDAALIERLATVHDDPGAERRSVVALLRRCPRGVDPELADLLTAHLRHRARDIGLELLRAAGRVTGGNADSRRAEIERLLDAETSDAIRITGALAALNGASSSGVESVRAALQDERRLVRDRTIGVVGLLSDPATATRARSWLEQGDPRLVAAAVESIEVIVPSRLRSRVVALCLDAADPLEQLAALGGRAPAAPPDDVLASLAEGRDGRVGDRAGQWTATCARYAIGATPPVATPGEPCSSPAGAIENL